jgi:hypothetical protein
MKLIKRLIELAFVILIISLFMKNKDIELQINYFGLAQPIKVAFWELVTLCVSLGIIIAALGDFITQLKWIRERRRMIKTDKEHQGVVDKLNDRIKSLETDSQRLQTELDVKLTEISQLQGKLTTAANPQSEAVQSEKGIISEATERN